MSRRFLDSASFSESHMLDSRKGPVARYSQKAFCRVLRRRYQIELGEDFRPSPRLFSHTSVQPNVFLINHVSVLDPLLVAACSPLPLVCVHPPGSRPSRQIAGLLARAGSIWINGDPGDAALAAGLSRQAAAGRAVLLFARGGLSWDGRFRGADAAVLDLVRALGLSLYCLVLQGAYLSWPSWSLEYGGGGVVPRISLGIDAEDLAAVTPASLRLAVSRALDHEDAGWARGQKRQYPLFCGFPPQLEGFPGLCLGCGAVVSEAGARAVTSASAPATKGKADAFGTEGHAPGCDCAGDRPLQGDVQYYLRGREWALERLLKTWPSDVALLNDDIGVLRPEDQNSEKKGKGRAQMARACLAPEALTLEIFLRSHSRDRMNTAFTISMPTGRISSVQLFSAKSICFLYRGRPWRLEFSGSAALRWYLCVRALVRTLAGTQARARVGGREGSGATCKDL